MSESAAIVERVYEAWRRMDGTPAELMHPEIEYVNPDDAIEPGTRSGAAGFEQAIGRVGSAWSEIGIEVERLVESENRVATVVSISFRGRASGVEVGNRQSHLWTILDGRVRRFQWFNDPGRALELIGA